VIDFYQAADRISPEAQDSSNEIEIDLKASSAVGHRLPAVQRVDHLEDSLYWLFSGATLVYLVLAIIGQWAPLACEGRETHTNGAKMRRIWGVSCPTKGSVEFGDLETATWPEAEAVGGLNYLTRLELGLCRNPARLPGTIFCRPFSTSNPADRVFFQQGATR
jgi:hypothetical protein